MKEDIQMTLLTGKIMLIKNKRLTKQETHIKHVIRIKCLENNTLEKTKNRKI